MRFRQTQVLYTDGYRAVVWLPTKGLRAGLRVDGGGTVEIVYDVVLARCSGGRLHGLDVVKCYCEGA